MGKKNTDQKDLDRLLYVGKMREKALAKVEMYNPNLVSNLSKEMYDIYTIRKAICEDLLSVLELEDIDLKQIKDYLQNEIKRTEVLLNNAMADEEKKFHRITIEELKDFL